MGSPPPATSRTPSPTSSRRHRPGTTLLPLGHHCGTALTPAPPWLCVGTTPAPSRDHYGTTLAPPQHRLGTTPAPPRYHLSTTPAPLRHHPTVPAAFPQRHQAPRRRENRKCAANARETALRHKNTSATETAGRVNPAGGRVQLRTAVGACTDTPRRGRGYSQPTLVRARCVDRPYTLWSVRRPRSPSGNGRRERRPATRNGSGERSLQRRRRRRRRRRLRSPYDDSSGRDASERRPQNHDAGPRNAAAIRSVNR